MASIVPFSPLPDTDMKVFILFVTRLDRTTAKWYVHHFLLLAEFLMLFCALLGPADFCGCLALRLPPGGLLPLSDDVTCRCCYGPADCCPVERTVAAAAPAE